MIKATKSNSDFYCARRTSYLEKNGDAITVIDDRTILLDKKTEELWMMGTLCKRVFTKADP